MAVHEITHPLVRHKLGLLREKDISTKDFRALSSEIGMLLTYEATRSLPAEKVTIEWKRSNVSSMTDEVPFSI